MGKITAGVLGGFNGKVGNVVGARWKGIDYMRLKVTPSNPRSVLQTAARDNMAAAMAHARANNDAILKDTFNYVTKGKKIAPINRFISVNVKDRDFVADFASTEWSEGNVSPVNLSVARFHTGSGKFTALIDPNNSGYYSDDDTVLVFLVSSGVPVAQIILPFATAKKRSEIAAFMAAGVTLAISSAINAGYGVDTIKMVAVVMNANGEVSSCSYDDLVIVAL